jgi:hypothetical protein
MPQPAGELAVLTGERPSAPAWPWDGTRCNGREPGMKKIELDRPRKTAQTLGRMINCDDLPFGHGLEIGVNGSELPPGVADETQRKRHQAANYTTVGPQQVRLRVVTLPRTGLELRASAVQSECCSGLKRGPQRGPARLS